MALEAPPRFPMAVCLLPGSCSQGRRCALPRARSHSPASGLHGVGYARLPGGITGQTPHELTRLARELVVAKVTAADCFTDLLRIEERSACQHGTCHSEQPLSDGPQGTGVVVALQSQRVGLGAADPDVMHGNPAPSDSQHY